MATHNAGGDGTAYSAMYTGVNDWNQLRACTKPLTLGLNARGATSCTTYEDSIGITKMACDAKL